MDVNSVATYDTGVYAAQPVKGDSAVSDKTVADKAAPAKTVGESPASTDVNKSQPTSGSKAAKPEEAKVDSPENERASAKVIDNAIKEANRRIFGTGSEFRYSVHEGTKQIIVKLINSQTKEVIKEIPPQKTLDIVAKMWELAGILVDKKK